MRPLPAPALRLARLALQAGERVIQVVAGGPVPPSPAPGAAAPDEATGPSGPRCGETTLWLRITKSEVRLRGTTNM